VAAWGFWAHPRINRMAVFTLPEEMINFYKAHIEYLTEHAVVPDQRRYALLEEAPRHYIDLENYGSLPQDSFPLRFATAAVVISEDSMQKHGILPWHIYSQFIALTRAFENKDAAEILRISAELGHYVADAHVPLHTTRNYNGQFTDQKGIHAFWESRLPELFGQEYDYFVGKAQVYDAPFREIWKIIIESHQAVDSVLLVEKELSMQFPADEKFSFENRNQIISRVYSLRFSKKYHEKLNGMVARRLRDSIFRLGSLWATAWVNAGQPNLDSLLLKPVKIKKEKYQPKLKIEDREASMTPYHYYDFEIGCELEKIYFEAHTQSCYPETEYHLQALPKHYLKDIFIPESL
jgi:hypothetical protein